MGLAGLNAREGMGVGRSGWFKCKRGSGGFDG